MERKAGFEKNQRVLGDKKKDFLVAQKYPGGGFSKGTLGVGRGQGALGVGWCKKYPGGGFN